MLGDALNPRIHYAIGRGVFIACGKALCDRKRKRGCVLAILRDRARTSAAKRAASAARIANAQAHRVRTIARALNVRMRAVLNCTLLTR
jgi:hypothetical protein